MFKLVIVIAAMLVSVGLKAQLKPGMLLEGFFNEEEKTYVAEILSVNGKDFTCRFVHSSSVYNFSWKPTVGDATMTIGRHEAAVGSSAGGKYAPGTRFRFYVFARTSECDLPASAPEDGEETVIVKFADEKSFLGKAGKSGSGLRITFNHSGSVYEFDAKGVVTRSGGGYLKGSKASIFCTRSVPHQ